MPDGKITFSTDLDNKGLEKQLTEVTKQIESAEKKRDAIKKRRDSAFAKVREKTETQSNLKKEYESASMEAKKTETIISDLKAQMAQYESIRDEFGIKNPVGMSGTAAELKNQEAILARQDKEVESLHAKYAKVTEELKRANEEAVDLKYEFRNARDDVDNMKVQATEISEQIEAASKNQSAFGDAVKATNKKFDSLLSRVSRLVSRVFVFSMITAGLRSMREWMGNVIKNNDDVLKLHAYDAMLLAEITYPSDNQHNYPLLDKTMVQIILYSVLQYGSCRRYDGRHRHWLRIPVARVRCVFVCQLPRRSCGKRHRPEPGHQAGGLYQRRYLPLPAGLAEIGYH